MLKKMIILVLALFALSTYAYCADDFNKITQLINDGKYQEAIDILTTLPDSVQKNMSLSIAFLQLERYDEAESTLIKVIAQVPGSIPARYSLAMLYEKKKDYPQALTEWLQVAQLSQNKELISLAQKHIDRLRRK